MEPKSPDRGLHSSTYYQWYISCQSLHHLCLLLHLSNGGDKTYPVEISSSCWMGLGERAGCPPRPYQVSEAGCWSGAVVSSRPSSHGGLWGLPSVPSPRGHRPIGEAGDYFLRGSSTASPAPTPSHPIGINALLQSTPNPGSHCHKPWQQLRKPCCQMGMGAGD